MRTAVFAALGVTILAVTSAYGAGAQQATTSGSFLRYRANSAQELTSMVRRDPGVAARYAKHFGTTKYGVSDYFAKRLRLIRLPKATTASVYYYNARGQVTRGRRVMPAGTLVFATETGAPVLDWRCGNPLTGRLPVRQALRATDKAATAPSMKTGAAAQKGATKVAKISTPDADRIVEKVLAIPPSELANVAAITPAAASEALVTTTVASAAPVAATSIAPVVTGAALPPIAEIAAIPAVSSVGAIPALASGSGGFSWLFPLAALGGAAGVVSKRSGGETITPPDDTKVPEPSSMLPLAAGLATACTAALRRRRQFLR